MTNEPPVTDDGFGIVPRRLRTLGLNAHEIAVYVALIWRADDYGDCFPSHSTVAKEAGCSVSSVRRAIDSLVEKGIVTRTPRFDPTGDPTSNLYHLHVWRQKPQS